MTAVAAAFAVVAANIPVRRMPFDFPPDLDLVFIKEEPDLSFTFLGTWFMLPYLEPYLIRSVQAALPRVKDPQLLEEMKRFCAQEGQHFRQHAAANDAIRGRHPGFAKLAELEAEMKADFERLSATKPLRFNLAYAEGFEAMTAAFSRAQMETGMFDGDNPLAQLALWHITEELEHRNVAFEVYEAAAGGYLYRLIVGIWAQRHFSRWGARLAKVMKAADAETMARFSDAPTVARRKARRAAFLRRATPLWLATYLPNYTPRRIKLPFNFETIRAFFTRLAVKVA